MSDKITLEHNYIGKTLTDAGLVGVNAGPLVNKDSDGTNDTDEKKTESNRADYKSLGVNSVRTHDFYTRFDLDEVYDIETGQFDWGPTDEAFRNIILSGAYVYLRLGFSFVRCSGEFSFMNSSKTQNTMCNVALAVVDRYVNATFAKGKSRKIFKNKIKYVEIWNEPDHSNFWPEEEKYIDDFVNLFYDMLTSIRDKHPSLKIGGPGFTNKGYKNYTEKGVRSFGKDILDAMIEKYQAKKNERALDFFSWHCYSIKPSDYQDLLEKFSSKGAHELGTKIHHITEWNRQIGEDEDETEVENITQHEVAALSACWMWMNLKGIHEAHFFQGLGGKKGIVGDSSRGIDRPIAYAFKLWSRFARSTKGGYKLYEITGEKSETTISWNVNSNDEFYGIGAYGENCYAMLLTNVSKKETEIKGDDYKYKISTPNSNDDYTIHDITVYKITQGGVSQTDSSLDDKWVLLRRNAVHLIVIDL